MKRHITAIAEQTYEYPLDHLPFHHSIREKPWIYFIEAGENAPVVGKVKPVSHINVTVQIAEVSPFELRHEVHNRSDQRISRGVAGNAANDTETLATEILGECAAQVGKGIFGPLGRGITPWRGLV